MGALMLKRALVTTLMTAICAVGSACSAKPAASAPEPEVPVTAKRFNLVCALEHTIGDERYVGSDHAPIPLRVNAQYSVDLVAERAQELDSGYVYNRVIAEVGDREVILIRSEEENVAFRRRDSFMVQVYSGPEGDVRVMSGPCRRTPFKPFPRSGDR